MTEKTKILNYMFEIFHANPLVQQLRTKRNLNPTLRYNLLKLTEKMTRSEEAVAFFKARQELIENHEKSQQTLPKKERKPLRRDDPKSSELFNLDSGLEIDRIDVPVNDVPENFNTEELLQLSWLFNFTNDNGENK